MEADAAAAAVKSMDNDTAAKILRSMKESEAAPILQVLAKSLDAKNILAPQPSPMETVGPQAGSARCEQGDFALLSSHWADLQRSLEDQGVRLAPLRESGSGFYSAQNSSHVLPVSAAKGKKPGARGRLCRRA